MIINIPGRPIPLKRHRHHNNKAYDSQKNEKLYYGILLKKQFAHAPHTVAIHVDLTFAFKLPKYSYAKASAHKRKPPKANSPYTPRPDIDNLIKFILDAGNDILWKDDAIITSLTARKIYDNENYTKIKIEIEKKD